MHWEVSCCYSKQLPVYKKEYFVKTTRHFNDLLFNCFMGVYRTRWLWLQKSMWRLNRNQNCRGMEELWRVLGHPAEPLSYTWKKTPGTISLCFLGGSEFYQSRSRGSKRGSKEIKGNIRITPFLVPIYLYTACLFSNKSVHSFSAIEVRIMSSNTPG